MNRRARTGRIVFFGLRFALAAPLCLAAWWFIMPYYVLALGQLCKPFINASGNVGVHAVEVKRAGALDTQTSLCFVTGNGTRRIAIGQLVTNIAPFAALILATKGLGLSRRLGLFLAGFAVLAGAHAAFLVLVFKLANTGGAGAALPTALGQLVITLPFLLWLVLCWWAGAVPLPRNTTKKCDSASS